ncbi:MAG: GNAT family N-acetyltransferase [Gaiellales bacterium]
MEIRPATETELPTIVRLWRDFMVEVPEPPHAELDEPAELEEIRQLVAAGGAYLAWDGKEPVGFALFRRDSPTLVMLTDLYVVPLARRNGTAAALLRAGLSAYLDDGVRHVHLEVLSDNVTARAVYQHWGFVEHLLALVAPVDALVARLEPTRHAVSFASLHVQSDDVAAVERAAAAFAPRIGSAGTRVEGPVEGWTVVYDDVSDRDPTALVRFARELSSRLGAVVIALSLEVGQVVRLVAVDRGGIVDEYLSVPEFYGPLPPGDVIGLAANPTVLHRLTGADPAAVKAVARTALSPSELPPAPELLLQLAEILGLGGAGKGYAG